MPASTQPNPASLVERMATCRARALECGALRPIGTRCEVVEDGGLPFAVRVLSSLDRKAEARYQQRRSDGETEPDPFLPYDPDLYVGDAGPDHVCLLNKFNVVDDHLLVVTRRFEPQESPLAPADFAAVWQLLWEEDGLAFYNSGVDAGASQPHKHLQLVLGPLCPCGPAIPIARICQSAIDAGRDALPELPLIHAFQPLDRGASAAEAADRSAATYVGMLTALDLLFADQGKGASAPPYNLLFTRSWMMVVPRTRECFHTISINALGFAGALLVRDTGELGMLKSHRPLAVLQHVARPREAR